MADRQLFFQTRLGQGRLFYKNRPFSVSRILLPGQSRAVGSVSEEPSLAANHPARQVAAAVGRFFEGAQPERIPEVWLDWRQLTEKEGRVARTVARIPYGATRTYGEIAALAGFQGAARFVGNTMAKNPFPVIIPCHRVIRADGTIGGFGGGTRLKRRMLELEAGDGKNSGGPDF